jgi:hypothetical protein
MGLQMQSKSRRGHCSRWTVAPVVEEGEEKEKN